MMMMLCSQQLNMNNGSIFETPLMRAPPVHLSTPPLLNSSTTPDPSNVNPVLSPPPARNSIAAPTSLQPNVPSISDDNHMPTDICTNVMVDPPNANETLHATAAATPHNEPNNNFPLHHHLSTMIISLIPFPFKNPIMNHPFTLANNSPLLKHTKPP
jgi:hypothetical protein